MRLFVLAATVVATLGLALPAQASPPAAVKSVTAGQCKRGGGFVYGGRCHEGTWNGQPVRG
jgi:hypothetical protein